MLSRARGFIIANLVLRIYALQILVLAKTLGIGIPAFTDTSRFTCFHTTGFSPANDPILLNR